MAESNPFDRAVASIKNILRRTQTGDPELLETGSSLIAKEQVISRYQELFALENLPNLTEEDFRQFLQAKNNRHWMGLQRLGPAICTDMDRLKKALGILFDETRPVRDRLNELVPARGSAFVPRLGKAVLTPLLLISNPDAYGVWNQISEGVMKSLDLWPDFDRKLPFGDKYEKVNHVLIEVAEAVGVDLWTLDSLWWRHEALLGGSTNEVDQDEGTQEAVAKVIIEETARFGLERHLHEFLRDNWNHTELTKEWAIYEEDNDPEAGYEYPCGTIGRIDLLARHRTERRRLVIELKRNQSSDNTVGQVLRYMGWVNKNLAEPGDVVEGLVIAHQADEAMRLALAEVSKIKLKLYEVDFRLQDVTS